MMFTFPVLREMRQRPCHALGRHPRLVGGLHIDPDLAIVLVAADAGDVVLAATSFGHPAQERLAQSVGRAVRQTGLVAAIAEPVAEPGRREGLPYSVTRKVLTPIIGVAAMVAASGGATGMFSSAPVLDAVKMQATPRAR